MSKLAVRRRLDTGKSFDLVCGVDLCSNNGQRKLYEYIQRHKPAVVVMSPQRQQSHRDYATCCAHVARLQMEAGRHFVSTLDPKALPWKSLQTQPGTTSFIINPNTAVTASSKTLLQHLPGVRRCYANDSNSRHWTWEFHEAVVNGICDVLWRENFSETDGRQRQGLPIVCFARTN